MANKALVTRGEVIHSGLGLGVHVYMTDISPVTA